MGYRVFLAYYADFVVPRSLDILLREPESIVEVSEIPERLFGCLLVFFHCHSTSFCSLMAPSSPNSPRSSQHAQRSPQRSPLRYTPYDSDRRRHGGFSENRNPAGPGQPGALTSYIPYHGPASGRPYDRMPLSEQNSRLPALTTVVSVDELSTEYGLDAAQRKAAHAFCKVSDSSEISTTLI